MTIQNLNLNIDSLFLTSTTARGEIVNISELAGSRFDKINPYSSSGQRVLHPSGQYEATVDYGSPTLKIYHIPTTGNQLMASVNHPSGAVSISGFAWSPDGQYLCALSPGASNSLAVFKFNGTSLTLIGMATPGGGAQGLFVDVKFSPCGKYIGVARTTGASLEIFTFDSSAGTVTSLASIGFNYVGGFDWSKDGNYIYLNFASPSWKYSVYYFNGSSLVEKRPDDYLRFLDGGFQGFEMSPDGNYLLHSDGAGSYNYTQIYYNDFNKLIEIANTGIKGVDGIAFSYSGKYFVTGPSTGSIPVSLRVYKILPSQLLEITACQRVFGGKAFAIG